MNPTDFWNKLTAAAPTRPTAKLVGKSETFTLSPGRLTADLELTPQREDELLRRKAQIEKDATATAAAATKTRDKVVSEANTVCGSILEEVERTKRKALRRLYAEYMEISENEAVATPKMMKTIATSQDQANGAAPARRRIQSVPAAITDALATAGGIPDKVAEVIKERVGDQLV